MKRYLHRIKGISNFNLTPRIARKTSITAFALIGAVSWLTVFGQSFFPDFSWKNMETSISSAESFDSDKSIFPFKKTKSNKLGISSIATITVNTVASADPTNCLSPNGMINITAAGTETNLNILYSIDNGISFQTSSLYENLNAGVYSVVVEYEDGTCTVNHGDVELFSSEAPVINNIGVSPITDCGQANGGFFIEATGPGGIEFSIDGGLNYTFSGFFSGLAGGDYSIVARNVGSDCISAIETRTLVTPVAPVLSNVAITDLTSCAANDGMITLTATGGSGVYQYSIDGGMSWQPNTIFNGLGAGTYSPAIRNAEGSCPVQGGQVTLTAPDAPEVTGLTVFNPSSCLATDGVVEVLIANGDVSDLEFSSNNGVNWQASNLFNGLGGGEYNIRVRNLLQTCFVNAGTVLIPGGTQPNIVDYFVQNPTNCNATDGLLTVIVDNDNGTFEYSINNGATYQTGNSFSDLGEGSYAVIVRDGSGFCPINGTTQILTEPESPSISDVTVNQAPGCSTVDASIVITAEGGEGVFLYSIDGGTNFTGSNVFNDLSAGIYNIAVSNASGTCPVISPDQIIVTQLLEPVVDLISTQPVTDCTIANGSITISANGGSGAYQYSLDNGLNWQDSNVFSNLSDGTYLIGIRNSNGTCEVLNNSTEIIDASSLTIDGITNSNPTDCGLNDGIITIQVSGGGTFEYSLDGINYQASNTFNTLSAGTYTVTARNTDGSCSVTSASITLVSSGGEIISVDQTNPNSCNTANGVIIINGFSANTTLEYSIDAINYQASNTFNNLDAGSYQVSIRNTDGTCLVIGQVVTLVSSDIPSLPAYFVENPTGCNSADGLISITVANDDGSFIYSIDGGVTFQDENIFTGLNGGEYNVIIASASCETDGGSLSLIEPLEPTVIDVTFSSPTNCDSNDGTINITGTGELTLEFSVDAGLSWQSTGTFNNLDIGTYTAAVRYQGGICPVTGETVELESNDAIEVTDIVTTDPTGCESMNGSLTIFVNTAGNSANLEYSIDNGLTFQESNNFQDLAGGIYEIVIRNGNASCISETIISQLTSSAAPLVEAPLVSQPTSCDENNGIIVITASGGSGSFEYSINNGASWTIDNSFQNLGSGIYTVLVRNANGTCETEAGIVELNGGGSPVFDGVFIQDVSDCMDAEDGFITIFVANDNQTFEYSINGGNSYQASNEFPNLSVGTYNVAIREIGSTCFTNGGQATVNYPERPQLSNIIINQPACASDNGSIVIEATGGLPAYEFTIDGGQTWGVSSSFFNLVSATYAVGVRNADSDCSTFADTMVLEEDGTPLFMNSDFTNVTALNANDGTITVFATTCANNTLEYSLDGGLTYQNSNFFDNLPPGTYTIWIRNVGSTNPISGGEVVISVSSSNDCPEIEDIDSSSPTTNSSTDGSITINASFGTGMTQYSIDGGLSFSNSSFFSGLSIGTYPILIQNTDGTCITNGGLLTLSADDGNSNVTIIIANQNPTSCGLSNGSISITDPAEANYSYSIDGGQNYGSSAVFNNLGAGSYMISVLDLNTNVETFYTSNPVVLTASGGEVNITNINATNIGCGATSGSITVSANGANNLEYSINNGASFSAFNTFNDLEAGNYDVVVQVVGGSCTANGGSVSISNVGGVAPVIEGVIFNDPSGCSLQDGSILVDATGEGDLEYSIDGGLTYSSNFQFFNLAEGVYTVFIRNANGACPVAYSLNPITLTADPANLFEETVITVPEDGNPTKVCVPAPISQLSTYDLIINGAPYLEALTGCNQDTVNFYTFVPLVGAGNNGPYFVDEWICNGGTFSGQVENLVDLMNQMNAFDPAGNWELGQGSVIFGGEQNGFYSNMLITHIGSGIQSSILKNFTPFPNGTCIFVDGEGEYILTATNDEGCEDEITIIVTGDPNPPMTTTDTIYINTLINTPTNPICFDGSGLPSGVVNSLGYCGDPSNGGAPITSFEDNCVTYFPNNNYLGQDEFCIVVCEAGGVVCDTTYIIISVTPPTNTINVILEPFATLDTCLTSADLTLAGALISGELCGFDPTEISVTVTNECVNLDPIDGFFGITEVCVVHCDNSTPAPVCDTTFFIVEVLQDCDPIFDENVMTITTTEPTAEICLPVPQLDLLTLYDVIVDGLPYGATPLPCNQVTSYFYTYSVLPNDGLDGPLMVDNWTCNSGEFSGEVANVFALLDSLQLWDPAGNWQIDTNLKTLYGGVDGASYGDMMVTPSGQAQQTLMLNTNLIAAGGLITIEGFGSHEVILIDAEGCSDTLTVNIEEDLSNPIIYLVTPYETSIDEICVDADELPGDFVNLGYCQVPMNGTAPLISDMCVSYNPLPTWIGNDTLCLIVCDDSMVAVCEETTFIITTLPPIDTITIDAPSLMAFDTCLTSAVVQLPGEVTTSTLCGFDTNDVAVTLQDTCLTIDLNDNFGIETTEICVVNCDDSNPVICDTTYVFINNPEPPVPCDDLFAVSDTTLFTIDGNSNICLPITPTEVFEDWTVDLDGGLYMGPIGGCDFTDAYTYNTNQLLTDGPYEVLSWTVANSQTFNGTAPDLTSLVDSLNIWNPASSWVLIGTDIVGITATGDFGSLSIQEGVNLFDIAGGYNGIPMGTVFVFEQPGGHTLVFTNNETGCSDTVLVNFIDENDVINIETFINEPDTTCLEVGDLALFDSLQICQQPTNGTFEIFNDTCFVFIPNQDYLGMDEGCIAICHTDNTCDTLTVLINVIPNCQDVIAEENVTLMVDDCSAMADYCMPILPAGLTNYVVTQDGFEVDINNSPVCGGSQTGFYDYSQIPGGLSALTGPYALDSITINGILHSGAFISGDILPDSLNTWDAAASWINVTESSRIENTTSTGTYDTLYITHAGIQYALPYQTEVIPNAGTLLTMNVGSHQVILTENITGCADTINVTVNCDMSDFPMAVDDNASTMINTPVAIIPLDNDNVNGVLDTIYLVTQPMNGTAVLNGDNTITYTPNADYCDDENPDTFEYAICNEIACDTATIAVLVACPLPFDDVVVDTIINLGQPEIICLDQFIDTTGIVSIVNECNPNTLNNVNFIIDLDTYCITLDPLNIGLDTACLLVCTVDSCINVTINVEVIEPCDDLFAVDNVGTGITDCSATEGQICLPILFEDLAGIDINMNGTLYTGEVGLCLVDTIYIVNYTNVPGQGQLGPYEITFNTNEMTLVDTFDLASEALVLLQQIDPTGNWTIDEANGSFVGGTSGNGYSGFAFQLATGATSTLSFDPQTNPLGTLITAPTGTSEIVFFDQATGCRDTLISTVSCVQTDTIPITILVGQTDTLCFETLDLVGNLVSITNVCPELSGTFADVSILNDTCIVMNGLEVGVDTACIVLCDDLGVCDTSYVWINVITNDIDLPIAVNDTTVTGQNLPVVFNPFGNDTINGVIDTFYILTNPQFGEAEFIPDGTINYVPNNGYCDGLIPDSLQYVLCNTIGCDTAWAFITVECSELVIYNGFTPNDDGVNDNFQIDGISQYPDSELIIYNRWGNRVYNTIGYLNDWNGVWDGKYLPDGTYFYILHLNDPELSGKANERSGWIQIRR